MHALRTGALDTKLSMGIKKLLFTLEMASQDVDKVDKFVSTLMEEVAGIGKGF